MKPIYLLLLVLIVSCKSNNTPTQNADVSPISKTLKSNQKAVDYKFDTARLLEDVKTLSSDVFEGRRTGTKGAELARDYIINRFTKLGVKPLVSNYIQAFTFETSKKYEAANVLGVIEGTLKNDKYIVLSAHYDHEGIKGGKIYNGADDDASGISALFAFAESFAENPPKHNVILAAFDAEELGLKGAYHFVEDNTVQNRNVVLNLNMDMISRSEDKQLFAVGSRYYPILKPTLQNFEAIGGVALVIDHEGITKAEDWTFSSDHAAFHKAEIPFIYFGVADHEDYHEPTDDFENINQQFYKDAVQTIITVFNQFDNLDL
ncbi:M28 family peptidase [Olleya sp. Bg11-27]|uniref:M28 family peptidase n=1 Tax=Olleya sp. Bg11-27 TaxID=2058135 RepID=UPI000C31A544|nr:M28 family peptidase [Olleya sp. Bg11-27]AUC74972.1 peptidase M20 [Olleya sp. Bg11-27]